MTNEPPRDGTEFWAIIGSAYSDRRWPEPVKAHWFRLPDSDPMRAYWGDGLNGWSTRGFSLSLWRGDLVIADWWPVEPVVPSKWSLAGMISRAKCWLGR